MNDRSHVYPRDVHHGKDYSCLGRHHVELVAATWMENVSGGTIASRVAGLHSFDLDIE